MHVNNLPRFEESDAPAGSRTARRRRVATSAPRPGPRTEQLQSDAPSRGHAARRVLIFGLQVVVVAMLAGAGAYFLL